MEAKHVGEEFKGSLLSFVRILEDLARKKKIRKVLICADLNKGKLSDVGVLAIVLDKSDIAELVKIKKPNDIEGRTERSLIL